MILDWANTSITNNITPVLPDTTNSNDDMEIIRWERLEIKPMSTQTTMFLEAIKTFNARLDQTNKESFHRKLKRWFDGDQFPSKRSIEN